MIKQGHIQITDLKKKHHKCRKFCNSLIINLKQTILWQEEMFNTNLTSPAVGVNGEKG